MLASTYFMLLSAIFMATRVSPRVADFIGCISAIIGVVCIFYGV